MDGMFEFATRRKTRFPSSRGELTAEQLWDLPLLSSDGFDLDTVARTINGDLKEVAEGSFVKATPDPRVKPLRACLDIVKHIIAIKLEEQEKLKKAMERRERRTKLIDALGDKEDAELASMSKKKLLAEIEKLDDEED